MVSRYKFELLPLVTLNIVVKILPDSDEEDVLNGDVLSMADAVDGKSGEENVFKRFKTKHWNSREAYP